MEQPIKTTGKDGTQEWRLNGKLHRDDGPAYIGANGTQFWYQHGKVHRDDGPVWIGANGYKEYWLNGTELTEDNLALTLVKERERRREASCGTIG